MTNREARMRGDRLRKHREAQGLSQYDLAVRVDSRPSTIHRYETEDRMPPGDVLLSISKVLGVSLEYLINLSDDPMPPNESLPPGWRETVREAIALEYSPDRAAQILRALHQLEDNRRDKSD